MKSTARQDAADLLVEAGVTPSYQRIMVLASLLETDEHPSADSLFKRLGSEVPSISKATVYNTLNLLVERGIIRSLRADGVETRFDAVSKRHSHFICRACHKIYDIPLQRVSVKEISDGHLVETEEIVLKGLCSSCRGKKIN